MGSTCLILRQRASLFTFLCSSLLLQTDSDQPVTKGDSAFSFHLIRVPDTCHSWRLEPLRAESTFQNQLQVPQMQPATTCVFFFREEQVKSYAAFSDVFFESHHRGCPKVFTTYSDTAAFQWRTDVRFLETVVTLIA